MTNATLWTQLNVGV